MAFSFPASPAVNDQYTVNNRTYTWTGSVWEMTGGKIVTAQIQDLGVTTAKIAENAVTQAKLASTLSGVTICTSSTKPGSPFTGQVILETDTDKLKVWDGSTWIFIGRAPADPPTSITVVPAAIDAAISFTAGDDNGSPITNYQYALSTDSGSTYGSYSALSPADATSPITISGLSAVTSYNVKLKAVNNIGVGVESSAASFTTLALGDFESIATTTVGVGGTGTITFSDIPSGYKHLQIRAFGQTNRGSVAFDGGKMTINSDTASNYSNHGLTGTGSAAGSGSLLSTYMQLPWVGFGTTTGSNWGGAVIDILDYTDTNKYKTIRALGGADGNGSGYITLTSGNWRSTSAITSVSFTPDGGTTFSQYSSFALYGIKG